MCIYNLDTEKKMTPYDILTSWENHSDIWRSCYNKGSSEVDVRCILLQTNYIRRYFIFELSHNISLVITSECLHRHRDIAMGCVQESTKSIVYNSKLNFTKPRIWHHMTPSENHNVQIEKHIQRIFNSTSCIGV